MVNCPSCNAPNEDGAMFCDNCGMQLPQPGVAPAPAAAPPGAMPAAPAPGAGGMTCPQCNTPLPPGAAFCDNCGAQVMAGGPAPQQAPAPQPYQPAQPAYQPPPQPYQPAPQPAPAPQAPFAGPAPQLLTEGGAQIALPPGKNEYIVGREDPVSSSFPDVDLTPHGGDQGGVSRRHARLYQQGGQWFVEDLGSTNFTFVNNQKVLPNAPMPVSSGAEVRFGRIKVTFRV